MNLLVEAFLVEYELADSLSNNTISIIKEPTGSYFVGFPYNLRASNFDELLSKLLDIGFILPKETVSLLNKMSDYTIAICRDDNKFLKLLKPNYLYSIPSYGGD